jgi:SAM-dependent methyltransferase
MINTLLKQSRILLNFIYPLKARSYKVCSALVMNKSGIEFGGPSNIFSPKGLLPLYPVVKGLDNCNYSSRTLWEGEIKQGYSYNYFEGKTGYQYVLDTGEFANIQSEKYDFVLGSHIIEHFANPIKAILEWKRILKTDGILIVVIPHKEGTFDNKRTVTKLSHLIDDYKKNTGEDDLTHIEEILELHDLNSDNEAGTRQQFKERSLKNYENRCLHHHVFNTQLAANLINYIGLQIIKVEPVLPCHIIVTAKKSSRFDNEELLSFLEKGDFRSYFKSDKSKLR